MNRRYRDKERSRPTTPPVSAPRATTPSEKKSAINVTVNPKSLPGGSATKSTTKASKKIDMGAASTFGRNDIGINSPTHRHTHAEDDLFSTNDDIVNTENKANELEDIFKTCPNPVPGATSPSDTVNVGGDDFFNPREEENQEFGDFASAFAGNNNSNKNNNNNISSAPVAAATETATVKKDDFADFTAAFDSAPVAANPTNDSANLLFGGNTNQQLFSAPVAAAPTVASTQKVGDLLSDLDGLSINTPVPSGKY